MKNRLSLNFFTNICEVDPHHYSLFATARSFLECFKTFPNIINVYVHPSPLDRSFEYYKRNIESFFGPYGGASVVRTSGLADGYKKSLLAAKTPYLFQLEHDWLFEHQLIHHTLTEIIDAMAEAKAEYFRF